MSAARLGFRVSFLLGALVLVAAAAVLQWGVPAPPPAREAAVAHRRYPLRGIVLASALTLVASSQETFLTAILPQVLPGLGVEAAAAVEAGGLLVFAGGLAGALGGLAAPRLAHVWHERRLVPTLLAASSLGLIALGATSSLWLYTGLRVLQAAAVAPLFPLVVARIARFGGGDAIGIVNAARVGSGFLGPVAATTLLTSGSPVLVYLVLGGAGLVAAFLLRR
jgi:MFS family permease